MPFVSDLYFLIRKRGRTVNTQLRNTISAANTDAQYDEKVKQLLSNKIILAKTIDEFQGMNPKDVVSYTVWIMCI